jgi:hypothetical protein
MDRRAVVLPTLPRADLLRDLTGETVSLGAKNVCLWDRSFTLLVRLALMRVVWYRCAPI